MIISNEITNKFISKYASTNNLKNGLFLNNNFKKILFISNIYIIA